jgi:PII-like signaling protein
MMTIGKAKQLTIYLGETDKYEHRALYMAIVEWLRAKKIAGATATRGIAGFGASSQLHTANILRLSMDMPLTVTVIDTPEVIDSIVEPLSTMAPHAMFTVHEVEVVRPAVGVARA